MQRLFSSLLAIGIGLTSIIIVPLAVEPSFGQTQNPKAEELKKLLDQATQQTQQQKHQQAIETLQKALTIAQQIKDKASEAKALFEIGFNLQAIEKWQEALKSFNQVLLIFREVGNRAGEAATLSNIGAVYDSIRQYQEALKYYNQALPILRDVSDRSGEATTLNNIGLVYLAIGQRQEALKSLNQALPILQEVGNRSVEATTLYNIGVVYYGIGNRQEALKHFKQSLPLLREVDDRNGEANASFYVGMIYRDIGQWQEALKHFKQSLPIFREVGKRAEEAATLNNIGLAYYDIGQPREALKYYNQALPILREKGIQDVEAVTLNNIGMAYYGIGQLREALKYFNQALPILREKGVRGAEASTLNNIGGVYLAIGRRQEALKFFNQSLPILREVGKRVEEGATLNNIGIAYQGIGQHEEALKYYNQALLISREVGNRLGEASTFNNIGAFYQNANRSVEAIANYEQSVRLKLQTRSVLLREQRQTFIQAKQGADIDLVSLLIERKEAARAYQWANLTATAELADYTRLLNAKVTNPEAQKAIDEWNQKNQQLQFLRQRLGETYSDALALQVRTLDTDQNREAEAIARRFPETADLFETTPADIAQLQASIPVGTTVIQPVLLTNSSNVPNAIAFFILTRDQLQVVKTSVDPKTFDALLTKTAEQLNNRFDGNYLNGLADLYDQLIRPIEVQIQATHPQQLSIIATGKLRYLPFEALYDHKTDQYLIQKYPINYLTRLSPRSLATPPNSTAPKRVLALGNPIPKAPLALPGTETEVKTITQILPSSETLIGNQATLDAFKVQALRFPFLHLATHGCFQKGGCPKLGLEENTILFADQRFNIADAALLGLQNVDLITLSACQTALQTNSNGEEIAGLAYLFERAGAKATIASLWSAEDKTTQEIMVQFYTHLKTGMSKGEALQKAKLSIIAKYRTPDNDAPPHPFFWAPFVLIGDAR